MLKIYIRYIVIIIIIGCLIIYGLSKIDISKYITPKEDNNIAQIDSLKNIIRINNIIIARNSHLIDSLLINKIQITNRYETTIENYSNPTIVSDDSISRYISEKLYNWR